MRITLLGTGSADGWPNPFCECRSCLAERASGRSRAPSCALVDDVVLIDCGPTAPHAIGAAGRSLAALEHVLITHGHPDHLQPAFLLARLWAGAGHVLHVWAPPLAIAACQQWLTPDAPIELHSIAPGDDLVLTTDRGDYAVAVLPAEHASGDGDELALEAVLFDITDPHGARLLYATDTAALPASVLDAIAGSFDVVLVDETFGDTTDHGTGHLDLRTLPTFLDALRHRGVITGRTTVVATHLSHHNPPTAQLRVRLAALGAQVRDDLDVIDTAFPGGRQPVRHLVLGGARSGKSRFAEQCAATAAAVTYVATGDTPPDDPEWTARIAEHRSRRPEGWTTIESIDLVSAIRGGDPDRLTLIDCLALWLTRTLDSCDAWARAEAGAAADVRQEIAVRIEALARAVATSPGDLILVSNEVGMGVVPATSSGRLFRDLLGIVNASIAEACDETTLIIAGRPLRLDPSSAARPKPASNRKART